MAIHNRALMRVYSIAARGQPIMRMKSEMNYSPFYSNYDSAFQVC